MANNLLKRRNLEPGSVDFGHAFEHFIFMELKAFSKYSGKNFPISYWRTSSGLEVDFILGEHEIAIETKTSANIQNKHTKGLIAFSEEYATKKNIMVSFEEYKRIHHGVEIWPWKTFLAQLWAGEII